MAELCNNDHRIYLISKTFSWGRLNITEDAFNKLLITENIFEHYNRLVKAFAQRIRDSANVHLILHTSQLSSLGDRLPHNYEVCYNVYYVVRNYRQRGDPWFLREIAIYHRVNIINRRSRWIFIQLPQAARTVLEQLDKNAKLCMDAMGSKTFELHLLLVSSMSSHWSEYIDFLGARVDSLDVKASYSNVEDTGEVDYIVSFADCKSLNVLQTKLRKARRALECCQDLACGLKESWLAIEGNGSIKVSLETLAGLRLYIAEIASHSKNITALLERSCSIASLVRRAPRCRMSQLTLTSSPRSSSLKDVEKTHKTSQAIEKRINALEHISNKINETSQTLANLARETNKDSLTLKALTLIATIYLPASLAATIFSSNLVVAVSDASNNKQSSHFTIAQDFWVFIVVTLCFMLFTFFAFMLFRYAAKRFQRQPNSNII